METVTEIKQTITSQKTINLLKAAFMAAIASISVITTQNNGLLSTLKGVEFLSINVVVIFISYLIVNGIFPVSKMGKGQLDWMDIAKGTLLAIVTAISCDKIGAYTGTAHDAAMLWQQALTVGMGYIIKTVCSDKGVPTFLLALLPANLKTDVNAAGVAEKEEKSFPPVPETIDEKKN